MDEIKEAMQGFFTFKGTWDVGFVPSRTGTDAEGDSASQSSPEMEWTVLWDWNWTLLWEKLIDFLWEWRMPFAMLLTLVFVAMIMSGVGLPAAASGVLTQASFCVV
eukprot:485534-Amphidinium_carterae.1